MSGSDPKQPPDEPGASGSVVSVADSGTAPAVVSDPATSRVPVATATEGTGPVPRSKRITAAIQDKVSGGVERLGAGIETFGEGVQKFGDRVPLVGANIGKLGEGLAKAGESIHALPRVAQTRRGRLLVRSVLVGFLLVFAWIVVIVGVQLQTHDTPDFRPEAERILLELAKGEAAIADIYEHASPRFQEVVRKERFINDMTDLFLTNGAFREITAINETLVTSGPTGRIGRVGLTLAFERGIARGSISFHWDQGRWKLLGVGVEVPADLKITQVEREKRVAACLDDKGHDVSDIRAKCDIRDAAETVLEQIRDGKAAQVWDNAANVFQQQESRTTFVQIQDEHRAALGNYKRLLTVTEARVVRGTRRGQKEVFLRDTALYDVLAEFERASGVRVVFGFVRESMTTPWKLKSLKVAVPMPRQDEPVP